MENITLTLASGSYVLDSASQKLTFTGTDGVETVLTVASTNTAVIADVVVENTDGSSETFETEEAPAVEATEDAPAA